MERNALTEYMDAVAEIKCLEKDIIRLEDRLVKFTDTDYGITSDSVSRGRKRRKSLGIVKITGFRTGEYIETENRLMIKRAVLEQKKNNFFDLRIMAEDFIESMESIEFRNLLSFYCIEGMSWKQVASAMNNIYGRKRRYTEDSCQKKYTRYMEKYGLRFG